MCLCHTIFYQYKPRLFLSHIFPRLHCNSLFETSMKQALQRFIYSWFKFTNTLLDKSLHTSTTMAFYKVFTKLLIQTDINVPSFSFGHLKTFLLPPPWMAEIYPMGKLWIFSGTKQSIVDPCLSYFCYIP